MSDSFRPAPLPPAPPAEGGGGAAPAAKLVEARDSDGREGRMRAVGVRDVSAELQRAAGHRRDRESDVRVAVELFVRVPEHVVPELLAQPYHRGQARWREILQLPNAGSDHAGDLGASLKAAKTSSAKYWMS